MTLPLDERAEAPAVDAYPLVQRVALYVTLACNLHCRHCYIDGSPTAARLGESDRSRLVALVASLGKPVDLTGGEPFMVGDLARLGQVLADADADPAAAEAGEHPTGDFDVIVAAGNVLTFIDPADRGAVLIGFRDALAADGRAVMGFGAGRGWTLDEFESDAFEAGLRITHRFSTWNLLPFDDQANFIVAIAERA